jgi:hypothetical protein
VGLPGGHAHDPQEGLDRVGTSSSIYQLLQKLRKRMDSRNFDNYWLRLLLALNGRRPYPRRGS